MKIKVRVPASTSNLGSGFDVFGAALKLYNEYEVQTVAKNGGFVFKGEGKDKLHRDESNLFWQIMSETFKSLKCKKYSLKNLKITINSRIPISSGLGSSASAIVGAIAAAHFLRGKNPSKKVIAQIACDIEGHPDNAVPASCGGVCLCYKDISGKTDFVKFPVSNLKLVIVNPSFEISTDKARKALPKTYPIKDIVFNLSRISLLTAAFASKKYNLLREAVCDKLHQSYRSKNIPFTKEIFEAAIKSGAKAAFISGSGPSLAAFCEPKKAKKVCAAMKKVWQANKIKTKTYILDFDKEGIVRF